MSGHDDTHIIADRWGRAKNFDFCGEVEPSTTWAYMLWIDTGYNTVKIRNAADDAWVTIASYPYEQNGFLDTTEVDLSWDDATRTLTVAPAGANFRYLHNGELYTRAMKQTRTIADTEGLWIFYFVGTTLRANHDPSNASIDSIMRNETIVAYLYWDATNNDGRLMPELHGSIMSPVTHCWIHCTIGAVYHDGMALADFVIDDDGDDDEDAQFSVASGGFYDEDIEVELLAVGKTAGLEIWYLDGADWRWTTNVGFSILTAGSGRMAWNNAGGQTEVTNVRFALCHVFATTITADDGSLPKYIAIQGQAEYATKALARAGAETEINALAYGTLPLKEIVPVATIIFQTSNAYGNAVKSRTVTTAAGDNYVDWRASNLKASGGSIADHGALAGLADDDHSQYLLADGSRALTGNMAVNAGLNFGGPTGDNVLTVPDNVPQAMNVKDVGGLEFVRIDSTNVSPRFLIDPAGTGTLYIGVGTPTPAEIIDVVISKNAALSIAVTNLNAGNQAVARFIATSDAGDAWFAAYSAGHSSADFAGRSGLLGSNADALIFANTNTGAGDLRFMTRPNGGYVTQLLISNAGAITLAGPSMTVPDGWTLGQAAGPLLTFDDTNNYLEITGCRVGVGTTSPDTKFHVQTATGLNSLVPGSFPLHIEDEGTPASGSGWTGLRFKNVFNDGQLQYGFIAQEAYGTNFGDLKLHLGGYDGSYNVNLTIDAQTGNVGIGTALPSRILDCNDGSGNMIADGYDNHPSWLTNKVDPEPLGDVLAKFKQVIPYQYKRIPYVSADELAAAGIKEFGEERWELAFPDGYRGGKLEDCPDPEIKAFLDQLGDRLREERQGLPEWQRLHYGLAMDDLVDTFPDILSQNPDGSIGGYSLNNYVGLLHACIAELLVRVERLE